VKKLLEGVIEKVYQYDLVLRTNDGKKLLVLKYAIDLIEPIEWKRS